MTTFPSIAPVYPASKGSAAELSGVQLGDGYKARYSFGLNNTKPEWKLEWLVDQISSDAIDLFLQSCADNAEFFQWKPPDSASELNWRCDEWTVEQQSYDLYSVKATFKRAFEPSVITLVPQASATCFQDELCATSDFIISSAEAGQFVLLTSTPQECNKLYFYLELTFVKPDGTIITESYNPALQVVTKFNWTIIGSDGRINTSNGTFTSASANFANDGSLINQYLNIYNGLSYYTYKITSRISSTVLAITTLPSGSPLLPQTEDRQYYIGGKTGDAYSYSIDGTNIEFVENTWQISRWLNYDKIEYKMKEILKCCDSSDPALCDPSGGDYNDPSLVGPISGPWIPGPNNGFPLTFAGPCSDAPKCVRWDASGYGQVSTISVCRPSGIYQISAAFWGRFGFSYDPPGTYRYPQFYVVDCQGNTTAIVNNGGGITLPSSGSKEPEFHLTFYS